MNIVLIGFRCSGKSTIGEIIAKKLKRTFVDCDDYIEKKTHLSVREIFDIAGESYFRTLEGWRALFAACGLQLVSEHWPIDPRTGRPASVVFAAAAAAAHSQTG